MRRGLRVSAAAAAMTLLPRIALAHAEKGAAAGFVAGFHHPLSGWDHILAMVAVGLWGAQLGVAGDLDPARDLSDDDGLRGLSGPRRHSASGRRARDRAIGDRPRPRRDLRMEAEDRGRHGDRRGIFAIFHGYAHGSELAPGTSALAYSLGFVVATGCLHGVGIVIGSAARAALGAFASCRFAGAVSRRRACSSSARAIGTCSRSRTSSRPASVPSTTARRTFFVSFEEILPVLALSLFCGLRGPAGGRRLIASSPSPGSQRARRDRPPRRQRAGARNDAVAAPRPASFLAWDRRSRRPASPSSRPRRRTLGRLLERTSDGGRGSRRARECSGPRPRLCSSRSSPPRSRPRSAPAGPASRSASREAGSRRSGYSPSAGPCGSRSKGVISPIRRAGRTLRVVEARKVPKAPAATPRP